MRAALSPDLAMISENYHHLRSAVHDFVTNISPASEYFDLVTRYIENYQAVIGEWQSSSEAICRDGGWFDDVWAQFTAYFLKRDIICYATGH